MFMRIVLVLLNHFPIFTIMLRMKDPLRLPGGIVAEPKHVKYAEPQTKGIEIGAKKENHSLRQRHVPKGSDPIRRNESVEMSYYAIEVFETIWSAIF